MKKNGQTDNRHLLYHYIARFRQHFISTDQIVYSYLQLSYAWFEYFGPVSQVLLPGAPKMWSWCDCRHLAILSQITWFLVIFQTLSIVSSHVRIGMLQRFRWLYFLKLAHLAYLIRPLRATFTPVCIILFLDDGILIRKSRFVRKVRHFQQLVRGTCRIANRALQNKPFFSAVKSRNCKYARVSCRPNALFLGQFEKLNSFGYY